MTMRRLGILAILAGFLAPILSGGGSATAQDRIYWAGYYTGVWTSQTDGSNAQHVIDTSYGATYEGWTGRGLYADLAGEKIYFTLSITGTNLIKRMNYDGSGVENVIAGSWLGMVNDVSLDQAGKIYWTENSNRVIRRANLDGSQVEDLYTSGTNELCGLAVDPLAGKMYWTGFASNKIRRANLDGTGVEDLVGALANPRHIELDLQAGKIYWTEYASNKIQRANLDGTDTELVLSSAAVLGGIALDTAAGKMYWRDEGGAFCANLDGTGIVHISAYGAECYPGDVAFVPEPVGLMPLAFAALAVARKRRRAARQHG